jgi:hypothetical protein
MWTKLGQGVAVNGRVRNRGFGPKYDNSGALIAAYRKEIKNKK